jgi:hypothetical protein
MSYGPAGILEVVSKKKKPGHRAGLATLTREDRHEPTQNHRYPTCFVDSGPVLHKPFPHRGEGVPYIRLK